MRQCATSKLYAQMDERALEAPQEGWRGLRQGREIRRHPRHLSHCSRDSTTMNRRRFRAAPIAASAAIPAAESKRELPPELEPALETGATPAAASSEVESRARTSRRRRTRGGRGRGTCEEGRFGARSGCRGNAIPGQNRTMTIGIVRSQKCRFRKPVAGGMRTGWCSDGSGCRS